MAEYSAAEHFNNPSRQRVPTVVEFTLPLEPTAARQPGGNFIHKTTSETLRLTDQLHPNQTGPSSTGQTVDIKKTSSFQITSVRVSSSISNDGEDDSCGEVDDSQTEPSEVGSHNHIDVDGDLDTGGDDPPIMFVSNVPVSLAQQQVNEGGALKLEDKDHGLQRRFRVVKIESAEPFKRGRWLCMDFLDQPSVQPTLSKEEPGSGASSSGSLSDHISGEDVQHPHLTSNLHQPNQTIQSISSGAALNSCNQQAQPSSSIQIVPHSLPASAASVSYPQTQQQLLQQPIYQTQSPVPLVYPVASVSMLQQPTVAAAATSNPASLAIPLITTQPTSSVTAGATLPSLSSNVAQPFVQQPVPPGLLQQQQQQPPMASQPPYTAPPVAQQQQQQQQQYVTPAATIQPGMTTQQHLPPQPQQTAQPVVAQIPVMAQQNLMTVPPSSSNNGAAQSSPHPPATALIQPSTSIPTQASSMHPVVLLPPPASLQQQPQPAPVVTVPIHGPPPGLIPQHPHPPIGLQQQQQQPGIQGQPTGAFVEVSTNPPVQSIQPSTQQLHQQQHVSQPSAAVVQPIGVPTIPTLQQQQQQQQPEGVMQQQPVQQMQPIQQQHVQQQSGSILMQQPQQQQQTLVQQSVVYGSNNLTMPTPVMSVATSMQPQVQLIMAGPSTVTTAVVSSSSSTSAPPGGEAAMGTLPHGAGILSKSQSVVQDDGHAGSGVSTDDHASASGSSTVAIDNKIEQAMDLVKSHLMFAVREEVEVLKERIDVLMERIAYLESENQILRAAATQETLAQIAQLEATFPGSGTDNSGGSSVSVVGVASSIGAIVNNTITSTTTTTSTTTSCTSSQIPNGTSPAP